MRHPLFLTKGVDVFKARIAEANAILAKSSMVICGASTGAARYMVPKVFKY